MNKSIPSKSNYSRNCTNYIDILQRQTPISQVRHISAWEDDQFFSRVFSSNVGLGKELANSSGMRI